MSDVKVQVLKDGPLLVAGKVVLTGVDGAVIEAQQDPIALCRCGHSQTKPFCDGSHRALGAWAQAPATLPGPPRSPAPSA